MIARSAPRRHRRSDEPSRRPPGRKVLASYVVSGRPTKSITDPLGVGRVVIFSVVLATWSVRVGKANSTRASLTSPRMRTVHVPVAMAPETRARSKTLAMEILEAADPPPGLISARSTSPCACAVDPGHVYAFLIMAGQVTAFNNTTGAGPSRLPVNGTVCDRTGHGEQWPDDQHSVRRRRIAEPARCCAVVAGNDHTGSTAQEVAHERGRSAAVQAWHRLYRRRRGMRCRSACNSARRDILCSRSRCRRAVPVLPHNRRNDPGPGSTGKPPTLLGPDPARRLRGRGVRVQTRRDFCPPGRAIFRGRGRTASLIVATLTYSPCRCPSDSPKLTRPAKVEASADDRFFREQPHPHR